MAYLVYRIVATIVSVYLSRYFRKLGAVKNSILPRNGLFLERGYSEKGKIKQRKL